MIRTTLALALGLGAVIAAALWTTQRLDPGAVATALADIESATDEVEPQDTTRAEAPGLEPAEVLTERSATWIEEAAPIAPIEVEIVVEDEELLETEPFEEAFVRANDHATQAPEEIAHHADDPAASATRIRRMLDVYRRNVQSER